ncbi:MAG: fasciclin domain-containing protein [Hyphomicrobiales bacterium]
MCADCNLVEALAEIVSATAFVDLLKAGGLCATLSRPGPLTLFVPSDTALSRLPVGLLESLCHPDAHSHLVGFLTRHFILGSHSVRDFAGIWRNLPTLWGDTVAVCGTTMPATVDGVPLSGESYRSANGVIHMIGDVLPFRV